MLRGLSLFGGPSLWEVLIAYLSSFLASGGRMKELIMLITRSSVFSFSFSGIPENVRHDFFEYCSNSSSRFSRLIVLTLSS